MTEPRRLREDARTIWQAGVDAVRSERLVRSVIERTSDSLLVCGREFLWKQMGRIVVVGAGKAGAGMAAAVEQALGDEITRAKVVGWVNVPADCVRPLRKIHLHAARPAGVNEPTAEGVEGSLKILELVSSMQADGICLVLISGGGSALLPAPVPQITLADKQAVTRFLMSAGATIDEMNAVRKKLSLIKGGRLAQTLRQGTMLTLIISDVVGDPLDVIASGPTVADTTTVGDALVVLKKYGGEPPNVPKSIVDYLSQREARGERLVAIPAGVENHVIGNNALALSAAERKAAELGYAVQSFGSANQGEAEGAGREIARWCRGVRDSGEPHSAPACLISGGEPVVSLSKTDAPRKGGRNQHLVLAAADEFWNDEMDRICILSGGTDGEDGPTDAAGAWVDASVLAAARALRITPRADLAIHNAYHFFESAGGLLKTGPTHTNVMDIRVALVGE